MIDDPWQEGTSQVKRSGGGRRVKVSADGRGVVSHAGTALLRELAVETGLAGEVTATLIDTYRGPPVHAPGQVFADLAVAIADGADAVSGIEVLRDRRALFGPVASMPTAWRLLDRIDEPHLERVRAARAAARERAWEAGAAPDWADELRIDFDATITIAHSGKQNAAATWKKTFGFHPLLAFLDRPEVAGGEALAGLLRAGNAGSNTAADHVTVLDMALAQLPARARPRPGDPDSPRVLARSDSAEHFVELVRLLRWNEGDWTPKHLVCGVAVHSFSGRIPGHDGAVESHDEDRVVGTVEDRSENTAVMICLER